MVKRVAAMVLVLGLAGCGDAGLTEGARAAT